MDEDTNMTPDPVWEIAWAWILRQHERENFDAAAQAELIRWLTADPAHRQAYEKANRLWVLAGLVPPVDDIDVPGCKRDD